MPSNSSARHITPPNRFDAAYRELSPRVFGYLRSHGVDDAEAATNDVFLALHARFDAVVGGDEGVRTLTFSIAHARLVDFHRAKARRPTQVEFKPEADPRSAPSAEDVAISGLGGGPAALLSHLGDDQRQTISLRVIAGLSLE